MSQWVMRRDTPLFFALCEKTMRFKLKIVSIRCRFHVFDQLLTFVYFVLACKISFCYVELCCLKLASLDYHISFIIFKKAPNWLLMKKKNTYTEAKTLAN